MWKKKEGKNKYLIVLERKKERKKNYIKKKEGKNKIIIYGKKGSID